MFHIAALSYILIFHFFKVTKEKLYLMLLISFVSSFVGVTSFILSNIPSMGRLSLKVINYSNSKYAESVGLFDIINIKIVTFFLYYYYLIGKK